MDDPIETYIEFCALEKKLSPATVSAYENDLRQAGAWLQDNGVRLMYATTADIAEYVSSLSAAGASASSVRRKLSTARGFFRFLQRDGFREDNPADVLIPPRLPLRLPHAISVRSTIRLIEVWNGDSALSLRNRALMELAYGAGLRESELTGMTVSRIMLEEALVRPLGKGSKERIVPVGPQAVKWLTEYIETSRPLLSRGSGTPVLFLTYRGNPLSRMTVWNIVRKSAELAGIDEKVHPHTLRHSFATHLLQGGADLRVVQELLGHSDIRTTEIYTGVDRTYLRSVVQRYHPRSAGVR